MSLQYTLTALATMFSKATPILVDASIKGAVVLAAAGLLTLALRRDSAAQRHLVWLLALGSTLALPLFSAWLPAWRVLPHWAGRTATTRIESSKIELTPLPQPIADRPPMEPMHLSEMDNQLLRRSAAADATVSPPWWAAGLGAGFAGDLGGRDGGAAVSLRVGRGCGVANQSPGKAG